MFLRGTSALILALGACVFAASTANAANVIINGNFDLGTSGFGTGYRYVAPTYGASYPENTFTIEDNPYDSHPLWVNETLPGEFLVVNGGTYNAFLTVFEEGGLPTVSGSTYRFSVDVVDVCCNAGYSQSNNAPFDLSFNIDTGAGFSTFETYDSPAYPNTKPGAILTLTGTFVAGPTLGVQVVDRSIAAGGNDFAIGNFDVSAVPEPAAWAVMTSGLAMIGMAARRRTRLATSS
jgi:hypothetical protein